MIDNKPLKLSFIAPTGYGKTTAAKIIQGLYPSVINIKLSAPLYELQTYYYHFIETKLVGEQDGELLQFLGYKTQKEAPDFLADRFRATLIQAKKSHYIITNDDCRNHNYPYLEKMGFKFVRINGFSRNRKDHTQVNPDHPVEQGLSNLPCDFVLNNQGGIQEYRESIKKLMEELNAG